MESKKPKAKQKSPSTKRKSRAAKLSEEQILLALKKKKECNARAQRIVEELLDPVPDEKIEYFLSNLIYIDQSHYNDIVEERAITSLCGYPFCHVTLGEIPKQKYHISVAQNKVYDITERKSFCSNKCYKSSLFLREQILTTPLWVRKDDDIYPKIKLLSFDEKQSSDKMELQNKQHVAWHGKEVEILNQLKNLSVNEKMETENKN